MTHWWRAYDDSIDHPKLLKLSDAMHRAWWTLMCVASANGGTLPPTADIAVRLRMKPAKVAEWITKLVAAKLIDNCDGVFRPHNWDDRQFISDSSTERVKRHRERKRNVSGTVARNVSNTFHETAPEQSRAETESEQSRAEPPRVLDEIGLKNEAVLVASFTALCSSLNRKPPDMRQIATWLLDGIALGTIQAAVTPILKRKADMASLVYCDSAVREAHGRAAAPQLQVVSSKVWVDEGTPEWACWQREYRGGRGSPVTDHQDADGHRTGRRGWYFDSRVPPGYDDVTCEKLPPRSEDAA
ncbi:hypothetical protein IVB12_05410 [Bradyrhizobium sp. 179]|uniref:hypothetical protein n=1 Tax=Bradyrhizobium sp. 179 TaxID=2782648 RepID=UPI001FF931F9|nr:hypothetical protein [Bradyrhizobium sp. 179]MCK1541429.1 hypothetical protein [Bradyrhizobium sp. 179]